MSGPVRCSWCGQLVMPKASRMRLFESESSRTEGKTLATFHPTCGDAVLDFCEKHSTRTDILCAAYVDA